jgi:hypothetical protein
MVPVVLVWVVTELSQLTIQNMVMMGQPPRVVVVVEVQTERGVGPVPME